MEVGMYKGHWNRARLVGLLALLGSSFCLAGPAQAVVIRHDTNDSLYRNLASDSAFQSVGRLTYNASGSGYLCTATLITSQWALTAAHCLDDPTTSNVQFNVGGSTYLGAEWFIHDQWTGSLSNGNDLAVFRLTNEVSGVTPATLYTGLGDPGYVSEYNRLSTAVGYGKTGTGLTGDTGASGTRRAGQNIARQVNAGAVDRLIWWDFDNPAGGDDSFADGGAVALEALIAPGDSGGGLFVQSSGQWLLAGVTSFYWGPVDGNNNADYGDVAGFGRVSYFEDWIAGITGYGAGILAVPVTGSAWLLLLGLGMLPRRRGSADPIGQPEQTGLLPA